MDLFVASNVQRARYENTTAFIAGVEALRAALGAADIRVQTLDATPEEVAAAVASAAASPAEGAALASTADLTLRAVLLESVETGRGDAAAATWIFRGDGSRRRRGRELGSPCDDARVRRSHGDAAAETRMVRGDDT